MNKLALTFAVSALCAARALAGETWVTLPGVHQQPDSLLPDNSGFSGDLVGSKDAEYATIVKGAFPEIYGPDILVRMFEEAAFTGQDVAVAIKEHNGRYRVIGAESTRWLWQYTRYGREQAQTYHLKLDPVEYHDVRIKRCSAALDPKLGADIVEVWRRMLTHVERADFVTPPVDAPWVYFSSTNGTHPLAGTVWIPFQKPRVSLLVEIAFDLKEYCRSKDDAVVARIRGEVDGLAKLLTSERPNSPQ